jgi:Double-GTPase 2
MEATYMQIMKPFMKKVICPYCSTEMQLRDCKVVSGVDKTTVLVDPTKSHPIFTPSIIGRKRTRQLASRQCVNPQCDKLLPRNIETVDRNVTIAIVGDTFSGKTLYIAALIEQLRSGRYVPPGYELCLLNPADAEVEELYQREYYQPLFMQHLQLPRTPNVFDSSAEPLIYEMTLEGQTRKVVNLLIYDVSGGTVVNLHDFVSYRPHLLNAKGILFMVDPWAIPGFSNRLAHHLRPWLDQVTGRVTISNILHSIVQLYHSHAGQGRKARFSSPIALVITKADLIPYLNINPYYHDLYNPEFADRLDIESNSPINGIIQDLLRDLDERSIVELAEKLQNTRFFVTSATGSNLDASTQEFPFIEPYRCLDPFFWLLHELGVLE